MGTKGKTQNRPSPRNSAIRNPNLLGSFSSTQEKRGLTQSKAVKRGSKWTWLDIYLWKKNTNKKPKTKSLQITGCLNLFSFNKSSVYFFTYQTIWKADTIADISSQLYSVLQHTEHSSWASNHKCMTRPSGGELYNHTWTMRTRALQSRLEY